MTADADALREVGARVGVVLRDPFGPGAAPFTFLVDTGADVTVFAPHVAEALGLVEERTDLIVGVVRDAPAFVPFYRARIEVAGVSIDVEACCLPGDPVGPDGLLGRDVLASLRFTYDGPRGAFTIEPG